LTHSGNNSTTFFDALADGRVRSRKRHRYYWNEITNYCNFFSHNSLSILEVGCGTGELLNSLKGNKKTGIDFSSKMVEIARSNFPEINFHVLPAENIELNEKYDLIILSNLIGYIDDIQKVFEQLHRVCHERTKIIVTYYNHLWEPTLKLAEFLGLKLKTPNQNWLTKNDIKNLLMLSGFDVYRETRRMIFPIYIPLLSEFLNNFLAKLPLIRQLSINSYSFAQVKPFLTNEQVLNKYSVTIVIPARNESGNIENAIKRMPAFGTFQEIIFVEGHSTDDTWEKINEVKNKYGDTHRIKIARQEGIGKNDAVRKGFSMAEGEILMILDADLTVSPEDLPKFYFAIATGKADFVNGSRLVYQMEKEAMRYLNMLGNKFFSLVFSWLLDQPFKDTLCGTKVLLRKEYENMNQNREYFGNFDPFGDYDLIFGAYKLNLRIVELPVRYHERTYGSTNISRIKHGFLLLRMCVFAFRKIKLK
jgi:ubiquinone/menaquinone biosynthesis C-methylase UbiE